MSAVPNALSPAPEGLRAQKHRDTRNAIAEAGLRLFTAEGFEATTLDAIAAAAGVSRRTIFNYFAGKEAILLAHEAAFAAASAACVAARPAGETPKAAARAALAALAPLLTSPRAKTIDAILAATPSLAPLRQAGWHRLEQTLFTALASRWPAPEMAVSLQVAAVLAVAGWRVNSSLGLTNP